MILNCLDFYIITYTPNHNNTYKSQQSQYINTHKVQNANEMLIIFQPGNFQSSTPVAVRVFKTGMLKLHGKEIQRMLGGERYKKMQGEGNTRM